MDHLSLESMTDQEIYKQVYAWYTLHGVRCMKDKMKDERSYITPETLHQFEELIKCLPAPEQATLADMYFVFNNISCQTMEWLYQERDDKGISMGTYARCAINRKEEEIGFDKMRDLLGKSSLYKKFSR